MTTKMLMMAVIRMPLRPYAYSIIARSAVTLVSALLPVWTGTSSGSAVNAGCSRKPVPAMVHNA